MNEDLKRLVKDWKSSAKLYRKTATWKSGQWKAEDLAQAATLEACAKTVTLIISSRNRAASLANNPDEPRGK